MPRPPPVTRNTFSPDCMGRRCLLPSPAASPAGLGEPGIIGARRDILAAMAGADDDTVSDATVADRPGAKALAPRRRTEEVERTRTFPRIGWIAVAGAVLAVLAMPGDRRIAAALVASLATGLPEPLLRRARKLGRELPWTEPEVAGDKAS